MVELVCRQVGDWSVNAYACICTDTRQSVLIDPGAEPDILAGMLANTHPQAILVTHRHFDHINALDAIRRRLNVPVMAHPGIGGAEKSPVPADRWLRHGDLLAIGRQSLRVYHTPGHTEDQVCFCFQDTPVAIVGDTLFEGGPGRTWTVQGFGQTLETLGGTVLHWPDETVCYPGHGPHFRLGDKRALIEVFLQKDHGEFYGDAVW